MLDVLLHDNVNDVRFKVGKVSILFVSNYRNLLTIRITTASYFKVKTKTGSISFLEPYHLLSLSIVGISCEQRQTVIVLRFYIQFMPSK